MVLSSAPATFSSILFLYITCTYRYEDGADDGLMNGGDVVVKGGLWFSRWFDELVCVCSLGWGMRGELDA